jgi:hypothetical protein
MMDEPSRQSAFHRYRPERAHQSHMLFVTEFEPAEDEQMIAFEQRGGQRVPLPFRGRSRVEILYQRT